MTLNDMSSMLGGKHSAKSEAELFYKAQQNANDR